MMKLLYVSFENSENRASGVNKKISGQIEAFEKKGHSTVLAAVHKSDIAVYRGSKKEIIKRRTIPRIDLCAWTALNASEYDVVYVRFQFFCPFVLKMLKACKKVNVITLVEIPTYPYVNELKEQGVKGIPKRIIDGTFNRLCSKYVDSFVSPLYGNPILGTPCIDIYNGINVDNIEPRHPTIDDNIDLLAVAMMAPWHGYDRLIYGIHDYYCNGGTRKIKLHLVGEGAVTPEYQRLIDEFNLHDHIIQYGRKSGAELDRLYDIADIGVGSLATVLKKIYRTNTLKILEYMAKGLPVICEEGEVGIPSDSKYRLTIQSGDTPLGIDSIIEFYDSVYSRDTKTIINEIRNYCRDNCAPEVGLKGVFAFLDGRSWEVDP